MLCGVCIALLSVDQPGITSCISEQGMGSVSSHWAGAHCWAGRLHSGRAPPGRACAALQLAGCASGPQQLPPYCQSTRPTSMPRLRSWWYTVTSQPAVCSQQWGTNSSMKGRRRAATRARHQCLHCGPSCGEHAPKGRHTSNKQTMLQRRTWNAYVHPAITSMWKIRFDTTAQRSCHGPGFGGGSLAATLPCPACAAVVACAPPK